MKKYWIALALAALFAGCSTPSVAPSSKILRVGVTPDSQPVIFKQGGLHSGIEASFAKKMGQALGREVVFVDVPWEDQLTALEENKTDIIMSGMTITGARNIRINFSTPYLQSGQTALFRRDSFSPNGLMASVVKNQMGLIGCVKNTTGEQFVQTRIPNADIKSFSTAEKAVKALKSGKVGMVVHDAPILWWTFAMNESELIGFPEMLSREPLAWGMRKGDLDLLEQVNAALQKWEEEGTRLQVIQNWIPVAGW